MRTKLTSLLTQSLLRPGGVRSLLIVVIGLDDDDTSSSSSDKDHKLRMVWNLVAGGSSSSTSSSSTSSSSNDLADATKNVIDQLFEILEASSSATTLEVRDQRRRERSRDKKKEPEPRRRGALPPPRSIVSATCYLLVHFLLSPPSGGGSSSHSRASYIVERLHSTLLPLDYYPDRHRRRQGDEEEDGTLGVTIFDDVDKAIVQLSTVVSHCPAHLVDDTLQWVVKPVFSTLMSLVTFLDRDRDRRSRRRPGGDSKKKTEKTTRKTNSGSDQDDDEDVNDWIRQEVESLVYVFGKSFRTDHDHDRRGGGGLTQRGGGGGVEELARTVTRAIETIEAHQEFGTRSVVDDDSSDMVAEWRIDRSRSGSGSGRVELWLTTGLPSNGWPNDDNDDDDRAQQGGGDEIRIPNSSERDEQRRGDKRTRPLVMPFQEVDDEDDDDDEMSAQRVQLAVEPGVVVEWLRQVARRELNARMLLRWLDELTILQNRQHQLERQRQRRRHGREEEDAHDDDEDDETKLALAKK